jgi:type IV secretion system protein VirB6
MISIDTFFSGTMKTVDAVIGNFVNNAYVHFIQANSTVITLLFTLYVMLLGYQFLSHNHHFQLSDVVRRIILMLCVYGLVMNWQIYHLFVYNIFTNEPANISNILISSVDGGLVTGDIATAIDRIYAAVVNATIGLLGQISFSASGLAFIIYALLVFVIGSIMCVYALLLFIYAKMMMAVSLALGPLFILFIMWDSTKGLFSAWLNKLITIALIPIITSAVLVLMLSVINVTLSHMNQPADQMQFVGIAPFLGLSLTTTLILSQVLNISSALGGGITIAGLSAGAAIASSALEKSGIAAAARKIKSIGSNRATFTYRPRGMS